MSVQQWQHINTTGVGVLYTMDAPVVFTMKVPCPSAHAAVVQKALLVDQELAPEKVSRDITVGDNELTIVYRGTTIAATRVSVHSCLQLMGLALQAVCASVTRAAVKYIITYRRWMPSMISRPSMLSPWPENLRGLLSPSPM